MLVSLQTIPVDDDFEDEAIVDRPDSPKWDSQNREHEQNFSIVVGKEESENDGVEMTKPRRITGMDLNQAFAVGDAQPVSKIKEMEQTEVQMCVEEFKTIEAVEQSPPPKKQPSPKAKTKEEKH